MTSFDVSLVDVCVMRGAGVSLEVLLLRRAPGGRSPGSWEGVHGRIEPGETPLQAAQREFAEETSMTAKAWYNLSRVESFYLHASDEVMFIPVFAVFVAADAEPVLSAEHDAASWLPPQRAERCCSWPRFARTIVDAVRLLGEGDAGVVGDALLVRHE